MNDYEDTIARMRDVIRDNRRYVKEQRELRRDEGFGEYGVGWVWVNDYGIPVDMDELTEEERGIIARQDK